MNNGNEQIKEQTTAYDGKIEVALLSARPILTNNQKYPLLISAIARVRTDVNLKDHPDIAGQFITNQVIADPRTGQPRVIHSQMITLDELNDYLSLNNYGKPGHKPLITRQVAYSAAKNNQLLVRKEDNIHFKVTIEPYNAE